MFLFLDFWLHYIIPFISSLSLEFMHFLTLILVLTLEIQYVHLNYQSLILIDHFTLLWNNKGPKNTWLSFNPLLTFMVLFPFNSIIDIISKQGVITVVITSMLILVYLYIYQFCCSSLFSLSWAFHVGLLFFCLKTFRISFTIIFWGQITSFLFTWKYL